MAGILSMELSHKSTGNVEDNCAFVKIKDGRSHSDHVGKKATIPEKEVEDAIVPRKGKVGAKIDGKRGSTDSVGKRTRFFVHDDPDTPQIKKYPIP